MSQDSKKPVTTLALAAEFVTRRLKAHREAQSSELSRTTSPLFVGVQGPQGCGKSYLAEKLPALLRDQPHNLNVATLSLDDLYLPHKELQELAVSHPDNKLVHGRGQPGTHDVALGEKCLNGLKEINTKEGSTVALPCYDKSRYNGQGDRSEEQVRVHGLVDIVIFEGWMVGFMPKSDSQLQQIYQDAKKSPEAWAEAHLDYKPPIFLDHQLKDILFINTELSTYVEKLWSSIDCFVQLRPQDMGYVWEWRLEQEHNMKAKNGGKGMTDDEVKAFVARYMPGYELFLDGIQSPSAPWSGKSLQIVIGRRREVVEAKDF